MERVRDVRDRLLRVVPSVHDFAPGRFVRKLSMVVGWCAVAMFVLMVAAVGSHAWLRVDNTREVVLERGAVVNLTTRGACSLTRCDFRRNSSASLVVERVAGDPAELTGVAALTALGRGVLWVHVVQIVLVPATAALCFVHGWSRLASQVRSYVLAAGACLAHWVLATVAYALYLAARPTSGDDAAGAALGSSFWLCFANSFLWLAMLVATILDKPAGLFEYRRKSSDGFVAYPSSARYLVLLSSRVLHPRAHSPTFTDDAPAPDDHSTLTTRLVRD